MSIENANAGRAADVLFRTFADQIRLGQLKEGEAFPPEREIVERYVVSRTVAREALQALASRGLIEARPRHRPIVRRPSYEAAFETVGTMIARLMAKEEGVRALFGSAGATGGKNGHQNASDPAGKGAGGERASYRRQCGVL